MYKEVKLVGGGSVINGATPSSLTIFVFTSSSDVVINNFLPNICMGTTFSIYFFKF